MSDSHETDLKKIEKNISKEIEEREDIRFSKLTGSFKVIYTVITITGIIGAGLFSYLNLLMVNRDEFVNYKESNAKETIALVEKEGNKLSGQVTSTLAPMVAQVADMRDKFDEAMNSFSNKLHDVERKADITSNIVQGSTLVRSGDLHTFERNINGVLQELRLELASIESDISRFEGKDQLLIQKIDSLEIELTSLIRDLDRRITGIEDKSQ